MKIKNKKLIIKNKIKMVFKSVLKCHNLKNKKIKDKIMNYLTVMVTFSSFGLSHLSSKIMRINYEDWFTCKNKLTLFIRNIS